MASRGVAWAERAGDADLASLNELWRDLKGVGESQDLRSRSVLLRKSEPWNAIVFRYYKNGRGSHEVIGLYPGNAWRRRFGFCELDPEARNALGAMRWRKPDVRHDRWWWSRSVQADPKSLGHLAADALRLMADTGQQEEPQWDMEWWDTLPVIDSCRNGPVDLENAISLYAFGRGEVLSLKRELDYWRSGAARVSAWDFAASLTRGDAESSP